MADGSVGGVTVDEFDMDMSTEFSEVEDVADTMSESALDMLPDIPETEEDTGPVLAKTYDGWGTVSSSGEDAHDWEGDKNLEGIYDNVIDNVSENEDLSNEDKIRQLESLKEQWLSEFE